MNFVSIHNKSLGGHMFLLVFKYLGVERLEHICLTFKKLSNFSSSVLHYYQQCMNIRHSTSPTRLDMTNLLKILASVITVQQYLIMVSFEFKNMTNEIEHNFLSFLAIYISSHVKCLVGSFPHFLTLSYSYSNQ